METKDKNKMMKKLEKEIENLEIENIEMKKKKEQILEDILKPFNLLRDYFELTGQDNCLLNKVEDYGIYKIYQDQDYRDIGWLEIERIETNSFLFFFKRKCYKHIISLPIANNFIDERSYSFFYDNRDLDELIYIGYMVLSYIENDMIEYRKKEENKFKKYEEAKELLENL